MDGWVGHGNGRCGHTEYGPVKHVKGDLTVRRGREGGREGGSMDNRVSF